MMLWDASLQYKDGHRAMGFELRAVAVAQVQGDGATRLHLAQGDRRVHTLHDAKLAMMNEHSLSWVGYELLESGQKVYQNVVLQNPRSEATANLQADFESLQYDAAKVVHAVKNFSAGMWTNLDDAIGKVIEELASNGREGWVEKALSKDSSGLATPAEAKELVYKTSYDPTCGPRHEKNVAAAAERGIFWSPERAAYVDVLGRIHTLPVRDPWNP